jgi:hypothetical protein
MKSWFIPSATSPFIQWLGFVAFLLFLCVCLGGFIVWLKTSKKTEPKRKRRHRHHRAHNPTLAQTGGLPPKRDPNVPPPGP